MIARSVIHVLCEEVTRTEYFIAATNFRASVTIISNAPAVGADGAERRYHAVCSGVPSAFEVRVEEADVPQVTRAWESDVSVLCEGVGYPIVTLKTGHASGCQGLAAQSFSPEKVI